MKSAICLGEFPREKGERLDLDTVDVCDVELLPCEAYGISGNFRCLIYSKQISIFMLVTREEWRLSNRD